MQSVRDADLFRYLSQYKYMAIILIFTHLNVLNGCSGLGRVAGILVGEMSHGSEFHLNTAQQQQTQEHGRDVSTRGQAVCGCV